VPWYSATAASEIPEAGSQASQRLPCLGVPRSERQRPLQKGRGFEGPTALGKIEAKLTERWRAGTRISASSCRRVVVGHSARNQKLIESARPVGDGEGEEEGISDAKVSTSCHQAEGRKSISPWATKGNQGRGVARGVCGAWCGACVRHVWDRVGSGGVGWVIRQLTSAISQRIARPTA
jgi:hypothetical protein